MKKFLALILAAMMLMAMTATAFADGEATLTGGEVGGFTNPDTPTSQNKAIKIAKELTVYNVDETTINAPTMSYTYAITAGAAGINVTDATTDHANNTAVTVQTKAGVTPGSVTLTGTSANTIAWTPAETVTASTDGTANIKYLTVDFSSVVFGATGVYRYVLTETPASYAAAGVTETKAGDAAGSHVRYLDVYVRPAPTGFTDGTLADDWDIYGYVCMYDSEEITDTGDTTTTGAMKTNGFAAGTNDGVAIKADSYYTFNVTISKTVTNDAYAKAMHEFPFTVIFTNTNVTQPVDISSTATSGKTSGWTDPASAAMKVGEDSNNIKGVVNIKDGGSVKYIGIPNGTGVEVYETNDVNGVTYQVTTVTDGVTPGTVDQAVVWTTTTPTTAVAQTAKENYQSTKTTITTTANADDDTAHSVAIDNNLQMISPTGLTLRIAPYVLMLAGGIVLLLISRRRKAKAEG